MSTVVVVVVVESEERSLDWSAFVVAGNEGRIHERGRSEDRGRLSEEEEEGQQQRQQERKEGVSGPQAKGLT